MTKRFLTTVAVIFVSIMMFVMSAQAIDSTTYMYVNDQSIYYKNVFYPENLPAGCSFDVNTNTLTLKNVKLDLVNSCFVRNYGFDHPLHIRIESSNVLNYTSGTRATKDPLFGATGNVLIDGGGILTVNGLYHQMFNQGACDITVSDCTINSSNPSDGSRFFEISGNFKMNNCTINTTIDKRYFKEEEKFYYNFIVPYKGFYMNGATWNLNITGDPANVNTKGISFNMIGGDKEFINSKIRVKSLDGTKCRLYIEPSYGNETITLDNCEFSGTNGNLFTLGSDGSGKIIIKSPLVSTQYGYIDGRPEVIYPTGTYTFKEFHNKYHGMAMEVLPYKENGAGNGGNTQPGTNNDNKPDAKPAPLAVGKTFETGSITYKVTSTSGEAALSSAAKQSGKKKITVPAEVQYNGVTYRVTEIGTKAFKGLTSVTQIVVGKNVKTIGAQAFDGLKNVKTINLSKAKELQKIGKKAFNGCKSLKTLTIGSAMLTKNTVKQSLKGSSVTSVKVPAKSKSAYKTYFAKGNSGANVTVK